MFILGRILYFLYRTKTIYRDRIRYELTFRRPHVLSHDEGISKESSPTVFVYAVGKTVNRPQLLEYEDAADEQSNFLTTLSEPESEKRCESNRSSAHPQAQSVLCHVRGCGIES